MAIDVLEVCLKCYITYPGHRVLSCLIVLMIMGFRTEDEVYFLSYVCKRR